MSPPPMTPCVVRVAPDTGVHTVHIQPPPPPPTPHPLLTVVPGTWGSGGTWGPGGGPSTPTGRYLEVWPWGYVTYVTVTEPSAVLVVRGVRDRLVITYPHQACTLQSPALPAPVGCGRPSGPSGNGSADSQGLLFFQQDRAHIDLFVFFSVFFSCFFLFLSLCVLLWKAKQSPGPRLGTAPST